MRKVSWMGVLVLLVSVAQAQGQELKALECRPQSAHCVVSWDESTFQAIDWNSLFDEIKSHEDVVASLNRSQTTDGKPALLIGRKGKADWSNGILPIVRKELQKYLADSRATLMITAPYLPPANVTGVRVIEQKP